jgi:hypothetical protein
MLREIHIDHETRWGAVATKRPVDLLLGKELFKKSMKLTVPVGTYGLLAHDNDVAFLMALRDVHPRWWQWLWIIDICELIPKRKIYSKDLPIIVDGQNGNQLCGHHNAPPGSAKLWRYMDFWKFEQMVQHGGILLSRADQFSDTLEGTLSPANSIYRSQIYRDNPGMAGSFSKLTVELEKNEAMDLCELLENR